MVVVVDNVVLFIVVRVICERGGITESRASEEEERFGHNYIIITHCWGRA